MSNQDGPNSRMSPAEITLNEVTPERYQKLAQKLEEYKKRLMDNPACDGYKAPELFLEENNILRYRITILERLLRNGKVDSWSLSREMAQELQKKGEVFDSRRFDSACRIIDDYVKTGGKHLVGGTGLK